MTGRDASRQLARKENVRLALLALLVAAVIGAAPAAAPAQMLGGTPVAIVTAETENEVLAVSLADGRVLRRVHLHEPRTVVAQPAGPVVVVSPSGTVALLAPRTLRPLHVFRAFTSPQLAAIAPDGEWIYVTDAATGDVSVIEESTLRIVRRVFVGRGAHHLAFSPDEQRVWVALGERARTIVVLDTSNPKRPRVLRRLHPRDTVHDLAFAPDGRTVWASSDTTRVVSVLSARSGRVLAHIPVGPPPQHVVFGPYVHPRAFLTSGYGSVLEVVDPATREVLRRVRVPYGSFNLTASGGLVVTTSLLDGMVAEFAAPQLARRLTARVAPAARSVAITVW